jgi:hypothetical protein
VSSLTHAPWNDAEKLALNRRQADETKHPYTCECGRNLIATHDGWGCLNHGPFLKIMQTWAHQNDIDAYRDPPEVWP